MSLLAKQERLLSEELEHLEQILSSQERRSSPDHSTLIRPTRSKGNTSYVSSVDTRDTRQSSVLTQSEGLQHADQIQSGPTVSGHCTSAQKSPDRGDVSRSRASAEKLACPKCDFWTPNLGAIRRHCVVRHSLIWQGKGLPLRKPFKGEITKNDKRLQRSTETTAATDKSSMSSAAVAYPDHPDRAMETEKKLLLREPFEGEIPKNDKRLQRSTETTAATDKSLMSSAAVAYPDNSDGAMETGKKLFACPNCEYKGDSDLAMKQHCVVSHRAMWEGDGKPLQNMRDISVEQSYFARLRKQRLSSYQRMREEVHQKSAYRPTGVFRDQSLQESLTNTSKSTEATVSGVPSVQDLSLMSSSASCSENCTGDVKGPVAKDKKISCPNCEYHTTQLCSIRRHCIQQHSLIWQGKELPLREPSEGEIPSAVEREILACTNCLYMTSNVADIQLHCIRSHKLLWQGKGLPLMKPDGIPDKTPVVADATLACQKCEYVTSVLSDIRLHCIRHHGVEWQWKELPLRRPGNVPDKRPLQVPLEVDEVIPESAEKSSELAKPVTYPVASMSVPPPSRATLTAAGDSGPGDRTVRDATFLSSILLPLEADKVTSELAEKSSESAKLGYPVVTRPVASTSILPPSRATLIATGDSPDDHTVRDATFVSSIPLPPSTGTKLALLMQSPVTVVSPDVTTTAVSIITKTPGITLLSAVSVSYEVSSNVKVNQDSATDHLPHQMTTIASLSTGVTAVGGSSVSDVTVLHGPAALRTHQSTMLPSSSITQQSVLQQSLTTTVSPDVTATTVSSITETPESLSCNISCDMEIDEDSATDHFPPHPTAITSLSTAVTIDGVSSVSGVTVLQVRAPLHSHITRSGLAISSHYMGTPPPPCLPVSSSHCMMFPPPSSIPLQATPCFGATQAGRRPLLPSTNVMLPRHPGTMPPPLSEQLTPFSAPQPGQIPRGFSAPPVTVCCNSGPGLLVNPTPVPPPGEFPRGLSEPSPMVYRGARPEMAINPIPVGPPPQFSAGLPAPSSMVYDHPHPERAANSTPIRPSGQYPRGISAPSSVVCHVPHSKMTINPTPVGPPQRFPAGLPAASSVVCHQQHPEMAAKSTLIQPPGIYPGGPPASSPVVYCEPRLEMTTNPSPVRPSEEFPTGLSSQSPMVGHKPRPEMAVNSTPIQPPGQYPRGFPTPSSVVSPVPHPDMATNLAALRPPGEFPTGLSPPSLMVDHKPRPEMVVNSAPIQPPGQYPRGFPTPSSVVCPVPHPEMATNLTAVRPPGEFPTGLPPPFDHKPRPEIIVNSAPIQSPGQYPKGFPAPSSVVCPVPRPEMATNLTAVRPPGEFRTGLPAPSPMVCHQPHPEMAANSAPFQPPGQFPRGLPAPFSVACHVPRPEMATNPAAVRPLGEFPTGLSSPYRVVCHQPRSEIAINSAPVQPQGQFPVGMPSLSYMICRVPCPEVSVNPTPGPLAGEFHRGFPAPSSIVCHKPPPEMAINPTPIPPRGELPRAFPTPSRIICPVSGNIPSEMPVKTPVPLPGDVHRELPAPAGIAGLAGCHTRPKIQVNPTSQPLSGEFYERPTAPSPTVRHDPRPEVPLNEHGQFTGIPALLSEGLPGQARHLASSHRDHEMPVTTHASVEWLSSPPLDVDYRHPSFDHAAVEGDGDSATDQLSLQPTSLPTDDSAVDVSSAQDVTVSQAPAPSVDSSHTRYLSW